MIRDEKTFLADILNAIESINRYIEGMDFNDFSKDDKTLNAVLRQLEVIGEATKRVSDETKNAHPDLPWRAAAGMRDRLIHGYFEIEVEIVWDTVLLSLPSYKTKIEEILYGEQDS
ncbi:MAG: DUF86 domain-containing protein [Saprospiraceae bacterium]|nr:DUF86 domain-containing protein [Saprospiraceae bacterium]